MTNSLRKHIPASLKMISVHLCNSFGAELAGKLSSKAYFWPFMSSESSHNLELLKPDFLKGKKKL